LVCACRTGAVQVASVLKPHISRLTGRTVIGIVEAGCAVGIAHIASLCGFVGKVPSGTWIHAGRVRCEEISYISSICSAGEAIGGVIVTDRAVRVAEYAKAGVAGKAILSKTGLVAGCPAEPGRVSGGIIDAGVALRDQGSKASRAHRVASSVNDDELLHPPKSTRVRLVVIDGETERHIGNAKPIILIDFVPLFAFAS